MATKKIQPEVFLKIFNIFGMLHVNLEENGYYLQLLHITLILFFRYHLKDVIVGKIYFLLVRIKIRHMEVAIIKRETTGAGPNTFHDNETIAK